MVKTPLISVVMPNYNAGPHLRESIKSILDQTYKNLEFIIIDDASTDESWSIIQEFAQKDPRVIAIKNDENLKICKSLNKGIAKAKGKYIARFDSDDICLLSRIEEQLEFLERPENKDIGMCGFNLMLMNEQGKVYDEKKFPETDKDCREALFLRNPFAHNTVLIRKEVLEQDPYNPDAVYAEDLDLWFRIGTKAKFHNIQKAMVKYRVGENNSVIVRKNKMIWNTLKVRTRAVLKLGYSIKLKEVFYNLALVFVLLLPGKLVFFIFNKFVGKK